MNASDALESLDRRDVRALTETLLVVRASAPARFFVYSESGTEYVVNVATPECSCPDHQHRGARCKHLRRVAYETGRDTVPPVLDRTAMDEYLVAALEARETGHAVADGGEVLGHEAHRERAQEAARDALTPTERADALGLDHAGDCTDDDPADDRLRCWRCYYLDSLSGDETPTDGGDQEGDDGD